MVVVVVRLVVIERDAPGRALPLTVTTLSRVTVPETLTVAASTVGVTDLTPPLDLFTRCGAGVPIVATGAGPPVIVGLMDAVATALGAAATVTAVLVALGTGELVAVGVADGVAVPVGVADGVAVAVAVGAGTVVLVGAGGAMTVLMGVGEYGGVAVGAGTAVLVGIGVVVATPATVGAGVAKPVLVAVGMAVPWQGSPHVIAGAVLDGDGMVVAPAPGVRDGTVNVAEGTGVALGGGVTVGAGATLFQSVARLARFGEPQPVASSQFGPAG